MFKNNFILTILRVDTIIGGIRLSCFNANCFTFKNFVSFVKLKVISSLGHLNIIGLV